MTRLFYAYATPDARLRDQLEKQLQSVKQRSAGSDSALVGWESREITRTGDWRRAASPHLSKADVVLFLMSADLVATGYLDSPDVITALDRQRRGEAKLFTVLLRPCNISSTSVAGLAVLPRDGKPVTRWNSADVAFQAIGNGIAAALGLSSAASPVPAAGGGLTAPLSRPTVGAPPRAAAGAAAGSTVASGASSGAPSANGRASLADIALPPDELGPEYASVDQPKDRDDAGASPDSSKFVTVARAGARRVAQLVFRASGPEDALARLSTAVHAELAKGAKAEPVGAPPEEVGEVSIRRVAATGGSVNVSTFAAKGRYLVAAKVMGGPAGSTAIGSVDPATLSERVVHRMLTRIPE